MEVVSLKQLWCLQWGAPRWCFISNPILFTVYIDELLLELEKAGVGCYWRHHFVGAVCYADDVALLDPSPSALRFILDTCRRVANSLALFFNAAKTQLICFSSCASDTTSAPNFVFLGESLSLCKTVTHLGHISRTLQTSELKQKILPGKQKILPGKQNILPVKLIICCTLSPVVINSLRPVYYRVSAYLYRALLLGSCLVSS